MPDPLTYRQTHSLLLVQRLLSFRPGISPLTVILDSLEQSGRPVVQECIARAKANKVHIVFLAFETLDPPLGVDIFLPGRCKDFGSLQKEVNSAIGSSTATLLILDTLHPLLHSSAFLPKILTSLVSKPGVSLLVTYHVDVPLPSSSSTNLYSPSPRTLLAHLSTTLLTPTSLQHAYAAHLARLRSVSEPQHGLSEGVDGVLVGLGANGGGPRLEDAPPGMGRGVVIEVEHRRRSGRGVMETVFLATEEDTQDGGKKVSTPSAEGAPAKKAPPPQQITLLDAHPFFRTPSLGEPEGENGEETPESAAGTFSLTLTERQKAERAGVVLPYFDAQREGAEGVAMGGRILYQMGIEDVGDWDSEEDEL